MAEPPRPLAIPVSNHFRVGFPHQTRQQRRMLVPIPRP